MQKGFPSAVVQVVSGGQQSARPQPQVIPAGQVAPQRPQFVGSAVRSTQELPHFVSPGKHVHVPDRQNAPIGTSNATAAAARK
jgi:hypothetical protein